LIWARSRQALLEAGGSDKLPKLLADADYFDVGTPLTYRRFLASDRGAWYGLEHSTHRFDPRHYYLTLRPETGIDGLYLTGQDVVTDGMVGALFGGYFCAAKVLGEKNPMALTKKVLVNRVKANVH
jgi:all-trans-retinol 13,14-reductase